MVSLAGGRFSGFDCKRELRGCGVVKEAGSPNIGVVLYIVNNIQNIWESKIRATPLPPRLPAVDTKEHRSTDAAQTKTAG